MKENRQPDTCQPEGEINEAWFIAPKLSQIKAFDEYLSRFNLGLLLLLSLEVLVGKVGGGTTDKHDSVYADAETGGVACRCRRGDSARLGSLGGWVAGL